VKLRRLRIENFKRFREPLTIDGFADGLNLFAAPNESGKSTVAEAIRAAFFERHRSGSVEHLRPWGDASAAPTVEVEFEIGARRYRLTKVFLGRKRCDLVVEGQPPLDGAAAEDHLAALLGFRFPGKGASAPEHMGIPGLLWIRQGTSHELADAVAHAADHLRQVLGESLGDLTTTSGDALLRAVEAARNELLTPATGKPRGEHESALQRASELAAEIEAMTRDIVAYQASVDRLAALRREHLRDERERPWTAIRQQHRTASDRLEAAQGLAGKQRAEQAAVQQWRAQAASHEAELNAYARDDAAIAEREQALQRAAAAEAAALAEVDAWERRHREAVADDAQARESLERVRAAVERAGLVRAAADLDATLAAANDTLARAREERTRLIALDIEAATLAIDPADLKKLKQLADALRDVSVRLDAVATTLEFDLLDGKTLRTGDETIAGRARRTVVARTQIEIEGVGRIAVTPGGTDLDALASRRDALSIDLEALLQRLAVANVAEAEERSRRAAQRLLEAKSSRQLLAMLAPRGMDALEADLAVLQVRATELRAKLAALPPARDDEALPSGPVAQEQAARARATLEATARQSNEARLALAKVQSGHAAARQELAAARATANDAQRTRRIDAARQARVDALVQEAAAQARADAIAAELKSVDLDLLRQDVDRLDRSAKELEGQHERRRQEITRLEVELETRGALGLEEQRAERRREQEAASRRAGELGRRAAALDHLLALLREKRADLARRLRAPLQKHLDRYLQILFPGASIEVADDLSPGPVTRSGPRGPESGEFEDLSVGTREQMGIVARLAYADLLQAAGRPTLLILDDALVNTDEERLGQMKRVLYDAAQRHQVLIFTCHPSAWRDLGVAARAVGIGAGG